MTMKDIDEILDKAIKENGNIINDWLSDKPGSWGALAGKAITATRLQLGRSLTESEKHIVWQMLWNKLMKIRSNGLSD